MLSGSKINIQFSEGVEGTGCKGGRGGPLRRLLAVSRCWKVRWKLFDILNEMFPLVEVLLINR